jgi:hypothetical protein
MNSRIDHAIRRTASGLSARFAGSSRRNVTAPALEKARQRIDSKPDFFASLSPEARAALFSYDGPEVLGPPDSKFKL